MTYVPPSIGAAGLTVPSYNDIVEFLVEKFKAIYGQTVYLGNDSADFQDISIRALTISDTLNALQLDYNNRAPNLAVGAALDSLVKLNGLTRKVASFSTCLVTCSGIVGTVITNGVVQDVNGVKWDLPPSVTIPSGGNTTITAICETPGAVNALANQINKILTPTSGWLVVSNGSNVAVVGQPVESDSQLRTRQALSTVLPSISMITGTIAGIAAVSGVTRYNVDENFTGATNANGTPAHSITAVVEGGTDADVATSIYDNKSIGCGTNGTTTVTVNDPVTGISNSISFDRPTYKPVYVIVNAHLLTGGTSSTLAAIKTAVVNYLNSLQIGERVNYGALVAAAMSVNANLSLPIVGLVTLFFALTSTPTTITDLVLAFNEVAQGDPAKVIVNSV